MAASGWLTIEFDLDTGLSVFRCSDSCDVRGASFEVRSSLKETRRSTAGGGCALSGVCSSSLTFIGAGGSSSFTEITGCSSSIGWIGSGSGISASSRCFAHSFVRYDWTILDVPPGRRFTVFSFRVAFSFFRAFALSFSEDDFRSSERLLFVDPVTDLYPAEGFASCCSASDFDPFVEALTLDFSSVSADFTVA